MKTAVFIDGAYLSSVLKMFGSPRIRYEKLLNWIVPQERLFRAYHYDCLPYQSANPTEEERDFVSGKQRFFNSLSAIPRFKVQLGRLVYRGTDEKGCPVFSQKGVDLRMGLDIANLTSRSMVQCIALVTGDSDFIPAVEMAQSQALITQLIHGPQNTYHSELWNLVDERMEITEGVLSKLQY